MLRKKVEEMCANRFSYMPVQERPFKGQLSQVVRQGDQEGQMVKQFKANENLWLEKQVILWPLNCANLLM